MPLETLTSVFCVCAVYGIALASITTSILEKGKEQHSHAITKFSLHLRMESFCTRSRMLNETWEGGLHGRMRSLRSIVKRGKKVGEKRR